MTCTWAVLLVKPFNHPQSRLAGILSAEERNLLTLELFLRTLTLLQKQSLIQQTLVISADNTVLRRAEITGALVLCRQTNAINDAATTGHRYIRGQGANNSFLLTSDLPFLTSNDIEQFLLLKEPVVVAPDRRYDDCNALLLREQPYFNFQFGEDGFSKHLGEAKKRELIPQVCITDGWELDLDTPADWLFYQKQAARQKSADSILLGTL